MTPASTLVDPQTAAAASPLPAAHDFPRWPASWYLFGPLSELRRGPVSKRLLGRELVAFQTESGQPVVLDARCSHLGADLGRGTVVGECIRCPFHEWHYGSDGRCTQIPHGADIPSFARQLRFPVTARHGYLFFFNGQQPLFPLPFFFDAEPEDFRAGRSYGFLARCAWFMVTAHAFDVQHFETVHGRRLTAPLEVDCPTDFSRRSRYRAEVLGEKFYDRFLRRYVGRNVEISITTYGGTFVVITGDFGRAQSRFFIVTRPLEDGNTHCDIIVFTRRRANRAWGPLVEPVSLALRRFLTRAYLVDETQSLGAPRYNPHGLIAEDRELKEFFHWAAALPQAARTNTVDTLPPECR